MSHRSALMGLLFIAAACAGTPAPDTAPDAPLPETQAVEAAPPNDPPPVCAAPGGLLSAGPNRDAAYAALSPEARTALLLSLSDCLENPDPALRDGYAYEMISMILRGGAQTVETLRALKADLSGRLATPGKDLNGFRGPFAALALAEVARTDRIAPWMSEDERSDLIASAHAYLETLSDYRGFTDGEGWRHGVAHTADILLQMSLNPELTRPQADALLAAIAVKAGPSDHAYVFGESERLAAPAIYLARKEMLSADDWSAWFAGLWPADDPLRGAAYSSEAALAKLHNLRAFAEAIYVSSVASDDARLKQLAGAALQFLIGLP